MTTLSAKVAVSIDAKLLDKVERLRALTGESRSALVARALAMLTGEAKHEAQVRRYIEAYRAAPETVADERKARRAAKKALAYLDWEDV